MVERMSRDWRDALASLKNPRVVAMLFLGISAGLPILLIFSTLSAWLTEADVKRSAVTFFSWAALGYSFKFVWAPLVDRLPAPILTPMLGQRRGWLILSQLAVAGSLLLMAAQDPSLSLTFMALAAVALGFSSATQDIVIDAYRIEAVDETLQAMMSAIYIAGYRIGMLMAGAGSLYLAEILGSTGETYSYTAWSQTYMAMAALMGIGLITTLLIAEPERRVKAPEEDAPLRDKGLFLLGFALSVGGFIACFFLTGDLVSALKAGAGPVTSFLIGTGRFAFAVAVAAVIAFVLMRAGVIPANLVQSGYVAPFKDFFRRYGQLALMILALIAIYRISDIVLGAIANVFYLEMGFTKSDIAEISKVYGLFATLIGGFIGGVLALRFGVVKILFLGGVLAAATNLLFVGLAVHGEADRAFLAGVIIIDNVSAGIASAAFVAYLSSLTSLQFTATQFALFTSLMTLFPKILAGYAGTFVDAIGYAGFFTATAIIGIPVLVLIAVISKKQHSPG